jgi:integrase/recombinase XerC
MKHEKKSLIPAKQAKVPQELSDPQQRWTFIVQAYLANRKPSTLKNYAAALKAFGAYLGLEEPGDFAKIAQHLFSKSHGDANATVFAYRSELQQKKLAASTINVHLAAIKSLGDISRMMGAVSWAIDVESLTVEPYRDTSGPGKDAVVKVVLQLEKETDRMSIRDVAIIRLLYTTVLRRKEVAGLDLDSYDPDKDRIWILGKGRTNEETITLPPKTKAAIERWLVVRGKKPGALFKNFDPTGKGDRLTGTSIYRIIKKHGLGHPHGLRHSGITEALDKTKGDVRAVQRLSRHKKIETLMIYDDNRKDLGGEVSKMLDEDV